MNLVFNYILQNFQLSLDAFKESNRYILGPPAATVFINDGAPPVIFLILLGLGLVVSAGAVALIGKIFFSLFNSTFLTELLYLLSFKQKILILVTAMLDTLRETINNSEPSGIPNITNNLINNVEVVQPSLEMSMGSPTNPGGTEAPTDPATEAPTGPVGECQILPHYGNTGCGNFK